MGIGVRVFGGAESRPAAACTAQASKNNRGPRERLCLSWGEDEQGSVQSFRLRRKRRQADFARTTGPPQKALPFVGRGIENVGIY